MAGLRACRSLRRMVGHGKRQAALRYRQGGRCENACNHDPTPNDAYRTDNAMKSRSERGHFSHPTLTPLNSKFTSKINQMVDSGVGSRLDAILQNLLTGGYRPGRVDRPGLAGPS